LRHQASNGATARKDQEGRILPFVFPSSRRFQEKFRPWIERILSSPDRNDDQLDTELREAGLSLRVLVKEIPPVFGSFY